MNNPKRAKTVTIYPLVAGGTVEVLNRPMVPGRFQETTAPGTGCILIKQGDTFVVCAISALKTQRHS